MNRRGVCYDVGRVVAGQDQRPDFDLNLVHRELQIIKNDLHCNAVRICGRDVGRLVVTAEDALGQGLEAWLSPELWDHKPTDTLDYLADAAAACEPLRQQWPDRVVLSVGSELTLFMQGILPGKNVLDRIGNPLRLAATMVRLKVLGSHNKPLNDFLAKASRTARQHFHGPITYASVPIEDVNWAPFDIISVDYYRGKQNRTTYGPQLERYTSQPKPVVITEVGCCTYQGAEDKGGRGFMIVDRKHPDQIKAGYVRDEALQARELADMLTVLATTAVDGAFVFTFTSPTLKYAPDPRHDFDMASYSLVKTYPAGSHATTYLDMTWGPKESFNAVANHYAAEASSA